MAVSQIDMYYDTRQAVHVNNSDPTNNPYTELREVPLSAEIRFEDGPNRTIDAENFTAPNGKEFETARFLIGRAILDPDAVVVPT